MKKLKTYDKTPEEKVIEAGKKGIGAIAVLLILIIGISTIVYSVPKGKLGCEFSKSSGWDFLEKTQGWHIKIPIVETAQTMTFQTQTLGLYDGGAGQQGVLVPKDKNGINFKVDVTLRYRIDKNQICEFLEQKGSNPENVLLTALRSDSTRGIFGQYAQEDVPNARMEIAEQMTSKLQDRVNKEVSGNLKPNFLIVEAVDIRNIQFDARIEEAIVSKQTRKQEAEKQTYILQQAEMERNITIVQADAQRQALMIEADAKKVKMILEAEGKSEAILLEATAQAEGIDKVNGAYQNMPVQFVEVKYAEALKELAGSGNNVVMDLGRFQGGNNLGIMDYNKLMAQKKVAATE